jgi:hypothetical protein
MKFYSVRSEAYFSAPEFFVNGRDHDPEGEPYLIEKKCIGGREQGISLAYPGAQAERLWKS